MTDIDALRLIDVTKHQDDPAVIPVLNHLSLTIEEGTLVGVWGRRRSGRSTLLRVAAGIERPDTGTVLVDGADLWQATRSEHASRSRCLAVSSTLFLPDFGTRLDRQVALPARRRGTSASEAIEHARDALDRVGLAHAAGDDPNDLDHTDAAHAGLARALMLRPRVLVLDEPTGGLKPLAADRFMELLVSIAREDRIAVLVTSSEVEQLQRADRTLSISGGVLRGNTLAPRPAVGAVRSIISRSSSG